MGPVQEALVKKSFVGVGLCLISILGFAVPVGVPQYISIDYGLETEKVRETAPFEACMAMVKKIYLYNAKVNGRSTETPDWTDPTTLDDEIGEACTRDNVQKIYHWTQYSLVVQNGYVVQQEGTTPAALEDAENPKKAPTLKQALYTLGEPKSLEVTEGKQYNWVCGETGAALQLIVYEDGTKRYSGTYCSPFAPMCRTFAFTLHSPRNTTSSP
jgi:hypothetical protein